MFNIYGIFCKTTWKVYYGSTTKSIEERLKKHENNYKTYLKGKYDYVITSYEVLKNNNYEIRLLEECDDDLHMDIREKYYIKTFPCVNKIIPGRTKKEWYEANKEKMKEYQKEYYETNKEKFLEYQKEYYDANKVQIAERKNKKFTCPCGSTSTIRNKARHENSIKHKKYLASYK